MSQVRKSILFFSKTERQGLIVLSLLILIVMWTPLLLSQFLPPDPVSPEAFVVRTKVFLEKGYRSPGAPVRSWEATEGGYIGRNPPSQRWDRSGAGRQREAQAVAIIEINAADSAMVAGLPGISPALAGRVIRFRNRLGGFVHQRQYTEVWGCSSRARMSLGDNTRIDSLLVKRICLNTCDFKELMRHPYGGYEIAKAICRFRDKFGQIDDRDELRQAHIIADSSYYKLYPYLKAD